MSSPVPRHTQTQLALSGGQRALRFLLSRKILVHLYKLNITYGGKLKTWHSWPFFLHRPETEKVSPFPFSQSAYLLVQDCQHRHSPGVESGGSCLGVLGPPQTEGTGSDINRGSEGPRTRAAPNASQCLPRRQGSWLEKRVQQQRELTRAPPTP